MAYREMPLPKAQPAPRKWPRRVVLAAAVFTGPTCGLVALMDFGSIVDGPGMGLFGEHSPSALFLLAGLLASAAATMLAMAWPTARWWGLGAGLLALVAFFGLGAANGLFHASWWWQCRRGSLDACVVAEQASPRDDRGAEAKECEAGDARACARLVVKPDEFENRLVCERLGPSCASCASGNYACTDPRACTMVRQRCSKSPPIDEE